MASDQEEIVRLASELQRLKYQTENYATMFAENDGLTHRLSMAEVREVCCGLMQAFNDIKPLGSISNISKYGM